MLRIGNNRAVLLSSEVGDTRSCLKRSFDNTVYMETPLEDKFITTESLVGAELDSLDVETNQEPYEERDGSLISRRLACNKEGYNLKSKRTGQSSIRKRQSHREGCMAMVLVKREKPGKWVVTKFVREHNHPLEVSSPKCRPNPYFDKDEKIRELSSQLHYANQQLEACQEQLRAVTACLEEHTQCLSTTVESVVSNVKKVESPNPKHEISSHW
ncbi:hypothetical protein Vadar_011080 [Vaccinium darrowii]|uniref:Uncharacterized protein n=1 Tax=Vaccinium darrowii TaxID=229202 RepID=A0ACB7YVJ8_9ERIC|nr:hypothetical protein Vadar_011080 [Vaccinium darrowii]